MAHCGNPLLADDADEMSVSLKSAFTTGRGSVLLTKQQVPQFGAELHRRQRWPTAVSYTRNSDRDIAETTYGFIKQQESTGCKPGRALRNCKAQGRWPALCTKRYDCEAKRCIRSAESRSSNHSERSGFENNTREAKSSVVCGPGTNALSWHWQIRHGIAYTSPSRAQSASEKRLLRRNHGPRQSLTH